MPKTGFDSRHSAVALLYFAAAVGITMSLQHLWYLLLSLGMALSYSVLLCGFRQTGRRLLWCVPLAVLVAAFNGVFGGMGLTLLFRIGGRPVTAEALLYGACNGLRLLTAVLWFACCGAVLTGDRLLSLLGRILPTTAMALSMTVRAVPDTLRRGEEIARAQAALAGGEKSDRRERRRLAAGRLTAVMGWSMEDALETADSMKARGYGVTRRSNYREERLKKRDVAALVWLFLLLGGHVWCAVAGATAMRFYPWVQWPSTKLWMYLPMILLMGYPLLEEGREWLRWRR